jgi:hypothetical protein
MNEQDFSNIRPANLVSSKEAARLYGVTNDYIARLARKGKLKGVLDGRTWFIDQGSLNEFFSKMGKAPNPFVEKVYAAERTQTVVPVREPEIFISTPTQEVLYKTNTGAEYKKFFVRGAVAFVFAVVIFAGGTFAMTLPQGSGVGEQASVWSAMGNFFQGLHDALFGKVEVANQTTSETTQTNSQTQPAPIAQTTQPTSPVENKSAPAPTTVVNNTYPVTQKTVEHVVTVSGVSEEELTTKLNEFGNGLRSEFFAQLNSAPAPYSTGGSTNNVALSQKIDNLNGVTISNAHLSGVTGLTASDIPDLSGQYFAATSSLSIAFGGTGTSSTPAPNRLLLSDVKGNWEYVSTSSLGITGGGGSSALATLTDVTLSSPIFGNLLEYNGSAWVNAATSTLGLPTFADLSGFSSATFPFTSTGYGVSTSTTVGFTNGLLSTASSTFTNSLTLSNIVSAGLAANSSGKIYGAATTTFSGGLTYSNGNVTINRQEPFPNNATSTLLTFNGGLLASASSTIGDSTQSGGLTINGGATTTGNAYFAGRVGIGTTSAAQLLDVESMTGNSVIRSLSNVATALARISVVGENSSTQFAAFGHNNSGTANTNLLDIPLSDSIQTGSGDTGGLVLDTQATAPIIFATGGSGTGKERLRIDGSGNVGIGSSTPWAQLSVNPNDVSGPEFAIGSSTATNFVVANSGLVGIGTLNPTAGLDITVNGATTDALYWRSSSSNQIAGILTNSGGTSAGAILLKDGNQNTDVRIDGKTGNVSYINNGSNFGVGTTSPYASLSVAGASGIVANKIYATSTNATSTFSGGLAVGSNAAFTVNQAAAANSLYISTNGNVGVGTANPGRALEVVGTGKFSSTLTLGSITSCTGSEALQTNGSGDIFCNNISASGATTGGGWTTFGDATNGTVTLATSTYLAAVGATTTPYAKLAILSGSSGTTTLALVPASGQTANILDIYNTSGSLSSVFTAGGFLGIGTTSPSQTLSVQGNEILSGNITLGSLSGLLKATNGLVSAATAGVDYITPSGLAAAFPFTVTSYGVSTSTTVGFTNGLLSTASSTFTSTLTLSSITSTGLAVNSSGQIYGAATTTFAAPLTYSNNQVTIAQANGSTNGYLASGDWTTFNNKVSSSSLTSTLNTYYPFPGNATSTLTQFTGGLIANASSTIGNGTAAGGLTVAGTATSTNLVDTSVTSSLLKTNALGQLVAAVAGTDYATQSTINSFAQWSLQSIGGTTYLAPTTTQTVLANSGLIAQGSSTVVGQLTAGFFTATSSTASAFNGGLTSFASSTIGGGTQTTGLTISGGATTTGNAFISGNTAIGTTTTSNATLAVNTAAGVNAFVVGSSTGSYFTVDKVGRVGVGTSTPGTTFSVGGVANFAVGTSTLLAGGLNLTGGGCYAVNGTCIGSGGSGNVSGSGLANQLAFWSGANAITADNQFFIDSANNRLGLGTSTPFAQLSVAGLNNTQTLIAADAPSGFSGNILDLKVASSSKVVINSQGFLGLGTTSPSVLLSLTNPVSTAQQMIAFDQTDYAQFLVDGVGNLTIQTSGGTTTVKGGNFFVCDQTGCPYTTATSTTGNIFAENAVTVGHDGYSMREIDVDNLGFYDNTGSLIMILDKGQ